MARPWVASRTAHLPRIVGFRNRIIYGCDAVDDATVWGVISSHLSALVAEVEALLDYVVSPGIRSTMGRQ